MIEQLFSHPLLIRANEAVPFQLKLYSVCSQPFKRLRVGLLGLTDKILFHAFGRPEGPARQRELSIGRAVRIYGLAAVEKPECHIYELYGTAADIGAMRVLYIGKRNRIGYVQFILFRDGSGRHRELGRCLVGSIPTIATSFGPGFDLVWIEQPKAKSWYPVSGEWIDAPLSIRMQKDLRHIKSQADLVHSVSSNHKNIKKINKEGFTGQLSTNRDDFDWFFERMYAPNVQARFGDAALAAGKEFYADLFQKGFLIFAVHPEFGRLAASLCTIRNDVFYAVICGVLDGDSTWRDLGALSALYWFELNTAVQKGLKLYDAGEVLGVETDGLYIHKRKWGLAPVENPWNYTACLVWLPDSAPIGLEWLKANRFCTEFAHWHGDSLGRILRKSTEGD